MEGVKIVEGDVEKCVGMWKSMGRGKGRCEGGEGNVEGGVGKMGRGSHIPYISPHFSHTPTHFSISPPHTSFHTFPHISPLLPQHFLTPSIFSPYLTQLPKLPKITLLPHYPYSSKLPQILYTPSFFPILHPPVLPIVTLSFTPHQNFSLFSVIAKLVLQSNAPETPCKFHKKKI